MYQKSHLTVGIGQFFEYLATTLVEGSKVGFTTGNADCCPDLECGDVLYESKASCKSEFLCSHRQVTRYHRAMDADPFCQVYYWLFDYSKDDKKLTGRFKTKRALYKFLSQHVERALLLPQKIIEALVAHQDFARFSTESTWYVNGPRAAEGEGSFYRFKRRGIEAIHENNGWMEQAEVDRRDYVVTQYMTDPAEMQFEASTFSVTPFRVLEMHPKVRRLSSPEGSDPFGDVKRAPESVPEDYEEMNAPF